MRIRHWILTLLPALALCAFGPQAARAQGEAEGKVQSSGSESGDASKGSKEKSSHPAKSDSLKELEDQIFRSFKAPPPKGPLSGPGPESPRPVLPSPKESKRARELQDRKDWVFMQPEEMMAVPTVEDLLHLAPLDKKEQNQDKLTPLESYLDRLYHPEDHNRKKEHYGDLDPFGALKKKEKNKDIELLDPASFNENGDQADSDLPASVRETQHNLKKKLSETGQGLGTLSPGHNRSFLADIFGLDVKAKELPSPLELEAQKQRMEQFRALYGFQAAPPSIAEPNNPLSGLVQFAPSVAPKTTAPSAGSRLPTPPANSLLGPSVPGIAPLPDPGALPDVAKFTITPPAFSPPAPKTERVSPPMPNFNAPRRPF